MDEYARNQEERACEKQRRMEARFSSWEESSTSMRAQLERLTSHVERLHDTHASTTLERGRELAAGNARWLDETCTSVCELSAAVHNCVRTHADTFASAGDESAALLREQAQFRAQMSDVQRQIATALGLIATSNERATALVEQTCAQMGERLRKIERDCAVARERALDDADWVKRECDEQCAALRASNQQLIVAPIKQMVDASIDLVKQVSHNLHISLISHLFWSCYASNFSRITKIYLFLSLTW